MTGRRAIHRFATDQRGAAAIEFAFVIGPLMLLMVGLVEVSRFVWVQNAVHEAAISGARCMGIKAASCASANAYSATLTNDYIRRTGRSWGLLLATSDIALNPASGCGQLG